LFLLLHQITDPCSIIYADLGVRVSLTAICIWLGKDFLFGPIESYRAGWNELFEKSKAGFKITMAIIASSLIPVMGRWVVGQMSTPTVYGVYSFSVSLLSVILAFTSVIGTVIFPFLKRLNAETLLREFPRFILASDSLVLLALFAYIPLVLILQLIMTEYLPVLEYLHILLAMCLPLGRIQLVIAPYYKAMRMEKTFLLVNLNGVACMFCATAGAYLITQSVYFVAVSTSLVMVIHSTVAERFLLKKIGKNFLWKHFFRQVCLMAVFILAASFKSIIAFIAIYSPFLIVFLGSHLKEFKSRPK
jgi:O-antigen/teichoic acid export membrane protein